MTKNILTPETTSRFNRYMDAMLPGLSFGLVESTHGIIVNWTLRFGDGTEPASILRPLAAEVRNELSRIAGRWFGDDTMIAFDDDLPLMAFITTREQMNDFLDEIVKA